MNNKYKNNFLLFVSTTEVADLVKKIREKINLPKDGLSSTANKDLSQVVEGWYEETAIKCDQIQSRSEFKNKLSEIKEKLLKGDISHKEAKILNNELHLELPINYLTDSIEKVISKYNLPIFYKGVLRNYIITNQIVFMGASPYGLKINSWTDKHDSSVEVCFYEPVTDKDLEEIKKRVNGHFNTKGIKRVDQVENLEFRLLVEQQYKNRDYENPTDSREKFTSTAQEIADIINEDYNKDLSDKEIYETPRQLDKLRKKRFGIK